ncbi:MAG: iron-sulfur cluster carrier protein ApbC [Magnetococcales bacterium]|nr:iron-sulfur cluster carrier protein ApbC [Magnetococcales bacterium]
MANVSHIAVLEALKGVMDPDLRRDIVSLGFIKDLEIDTAGRVAFTLELTTPACPVKEKLKSQAEEVVATLDGVAAVTVKLSSRVTGGGRPKAGNLLPGVKNIIAVASGKGGVGKSTTAVNLALALSQTGATVGVLDADIYGPSLPRLLNLQGKPVAAETPDGDNPQVAPMEAYGLKAISIGLFLPEDAPMVWRGPMVGMAVEQLLRDIAWGELDYLVVDLPPGTGDAQLTLTQKVPLTGVVIVSTPQDVALADVKKGINMFRKVDVPILGIVENMSYYLCPSCGHRENIFDHGGARREAENSGIFFLGEIPLDPQIRVDADAGRPILLTHPDHPQSRIYREIAANLAARVASQNYHAGSTIPNIVVE